MKMGTVATNFIEYNVPVGEILNTMTLKNMQEDDFTSFDSLFETANLNGLFGDLSNSFDYATTKSVINFQFNNWLQLSKGWDTLDPAVFQGFLKKSVFLEFMQFREKKMIKEQKDVHEEGSTWKLPPPSPNSMPTAELKESINDLCSQRSGRDLVFVTYCWGNSEYQSKIRSLTFQLRQNGENAEMDQMELQRETALQFQTMMLWKLNQAKKVIVILSEGYKRKAENREGGVFFEYKIILAEIDQNPSKYIFITFDDYSDKIVPLGFAKRFVMSLKNEDDFRQLLRKLQGVDEYNFGDVAPLKQAILPGKIPLLFAESGKHSQPVSGMQPKLSAYQIKVLRFLKSVRGFKLSGYGSIAFNVEITSVDKAREICKELEELGLADIKNDRVQSTGLAEQWLNIYDDIVNQQIREYVYDDYEFALLRYIYHQEIPVHRNDIPKLLEENAPRNTKGYPSMNLLHMLEIELKQFVKQVGGKSYELTAEGKIYVEMQANKYNYNLSFMARS